jgi:glc operon protein GlcG
MFQRLSRNSTLIPRRLSNKLLVAQQPAPQQATPPYGAPISLQQAKKVIAAAEAEAEKNKWFVAITVVDSGGYLVATHRLDNTQLGSISYAQDKARSAVLYRRPPRHSRTPSRTVGLH